MRRARTALFLVGLISMCAFAHAEEDSIKRLYPLKYLHPHVAMLEVQAAYPASMEAGIELRPEGAGSAGFLRVVAPAADQEAIARVLAEKDVPVPSVRLQLVLLDAMDTSLPEPELPGGAAAALKDVRTLFPFKGYRIRSTAVLPTFGDGRAGLDPGVTMGNEFVLTVEARTSASGKVEVESLRLMGQGGIGPRGVVSTSGNVHLSELLVTSFTIDRGETVVLGTSLVPATKTKLDPDVPRALVLLVTALP